MTTDVNPFRDETTHAQFQLMKNYNFNKTRVHLRFIVEPEQLTLPENNRRTDNTMAKRKWTNNDLQDIHIKLKIE
jgi:hypothetical protein